MVAEEADAGRANGLVADQPVLTPSDCVQPRRAKRRKRRISEVSSDVGAVTGQQAREQVRACWFMAMSGSKSGNQRARSRIGIAAEPSPCQMSDTTSWRSKLRWTIGSASGWSPATRLEPKVLREHLCIDEYGLVAEQCM